VRRHEHVPARLDPGALERRGVGQGARLEEQRYVDHHVPDEFDPPRRVLALEVLDRRPPAKRPPLYGDGRAGPRVVAALAGVPAAR